MQIAPGGFEQFDPDVVGFEQRHVDIKEDQHGVGGFRKRGLMTTDFEVEFLGFGADIGVDFSFDETRGLFAEGGQEGVKVVFRALGFEHDGTVGLVSDPACDWVSLGDGA